MNKDIENTLTAIGAIAGSITVELGVACARAWLLMTVVAWFAPAIALGFWQWVLVVVTIRFVLIDLNSSKK
tara:strand:- start:1645 stop:1857 length:213 start_codon:yes stop_codon:yes gene_type:complete